MNEEKDSWIAHVYGFISDWWWRWSRLFSIVLTSSIIHLAMVMQIVLFCWMIMMNCCKLISMIILLLYWVWVICSLLDIGTIQNAAKEFQASIEESKVGVVILAKDRPPFKISVIWSSLFLNDNIIRICLLFIPFWWVNVCKNSDLVLSTR